MSELIVLTFQGADKAEMVRENLSKLEEEGKVTIEDAVVVYRPEQDDSMLGGAAANQVNLNLKAMSAQSADVQIERDKSSVRKKFTRGGGAIGLLAGLVLGGPIGAAVVGAGLGNVLARMKDHGIDQKFVEEVGEHMQPDSSAIFLFGSAEDPEALMDELRPFSPRLLSTTLDEEQQQRLRKNIS